MSETIRLSAKTCWIIRARRAGRTLYLESHKAWNKSPAAATIFRAFDAAEHEVYRARALGLVAKDEILEIVPLYGALVTAR